MLNRIAFLVFMVFISTAALAGTADVVVYTDRDAFNAALASGSSVTDDFSSYELGPDGCEVISNSDMSSLFTVQNGVTTEFESTFWDNQNMINEETPDNPQFCWGCDGSGQLSFPDGDVWAMGMDVLWAWGGDGPEGQWFAFVTLQGGEQWQIQLPHVFFEPSEFWGIVSDVPILSGHFGAGGGEPWVNGEFTIDNLTLGQLPESPLFADSFELGDTSAWTTSGSPPDQD